MNSIAHKFAGKARTARTAAKTTKTTMFAGTAVATLVFLFLSDLQAQRPSFPPEHAPQSARPQAAPALAMTMVFEEGLVTADITETPLENVLAELAERTGVIFEVRTQENPRVSIHLKRVPLEEAIRRIVLGNDTVFHYGPDSRLEQVKVLPRNAQSPQPGIAYYGTGKITRTGAPVETPEQALQAVIGKAGIEDREKGIGILAKNRSAEGVKALMACLRDPAPEIRVAAIEALAAMNAHDALPGIVRNLRHANPGVRQSAATAVALLGDAGNLTDLKPLSADKDARVAAAAEVAIRKLSASPGKRK